MMRHRLIGPPLARSTNRSTTQRGNTVILQMCHHISPPADIHAVDSAFGFNIAPNMNKTAAMMDASHTAIRSGHAVGIRNTLLKHRHDNVADVMRSTDIIGRNA
jgi:hypothetical protein